MDKKLFEKYLVKIDDAMNEELIVNRFRQDLQSYMQIYGRVYDRAAIKHAIGAVFNQYSSGAVIEKNTVIALAMSTFNFSREEFNLVKEDVISFIENDFKKGKRSFLQKVIGKYKQDCLKLRNECTKNKNH